MNQVGEAFPTLPQLFDLIDSPSYATTKKPIVYQAQRPSTSATQNYRTASTPSSINKRRKKPAQVTTASTTDNFMKTESTFYSPTTNTSFQYEPYCFSELKTIKRPLKKLYSSRQYESLNKKRDDLKDKYSNLYANPNIKREELSPEKFQELYLGAEKMFNTSYSIKYMGLMNDKLGVVSQRVPMNQSLVTQYFLPKKLQSVKKKDNDISQASETMGRWHVADKSEEKEKTSTTQEDLNRTANKEVSWIVESPEQRRRIWQKVTVADQKKENTANFTRKVESMSKVKNSLLRNVRMEKAWMAKGIKDDLDVLEKSRTFELRNVMANSAKYSYSKLLKTMRTKERPETSLIENTQKREKILATRDEKKRMMQRQDLDNVGEIDTRDHGNNYVVKIQYPKENKMLNRFIKIRENVDA